MKKYFLSKINLIQVFLYTYLIFNIYGCTSETFLVSSNSTFLKHYLNQSDAFCYGSDGMEIYNWVENKTRNNSTVLAGFETKYVPGSWPFPCNRLHRFIGQGVFKFDLTEIANRISFASYLSAKIIISDYLPESGRVVTSDAIWGGGDQFVSSGSNDPIDTYELKLINTNWDFENWGTSFISSITLPNGKPWNKFEVPFISTNQPNMFSNRGVLTAEIDVSEIVRQILNNGGRYGNGIFGFSIEPSGRSLNYIRSNHSAGRFNIRLEIHRRTN
ncbi:MAG: hypothetical protein IPK94_07785 [Saprospiraceae bacterium]|nr:hypothetical protein [Saprospiraceae bacterium]